MEDLEICMRCGFCRASCPIFEETMAESGTARGKIAIINALKRGDLEPSKAIAKKIFECTLCGKCSLDCPAGVDTTKIFIEARREIIKTHLPLKKRASFKLLENPGALSLLGKTASVIPDQFLNFPSKVSKSVPQRLKNPKMKVAFFGGCLTNYILPDLRESSAEVLIRNNIQSLPLKEKCCGLPLYFSGAIERARELAKYNLSLMDNIEVDAVVTACPTCKIGIKKYPEILEGAERERAQELADKTYEICEFLGKFGYSKDLGNLEKTLTIHESCHMKYGLDLSGIVREQITSIPGAELREMDNPDACCGFGGFFSIDNPDLSRKIINKKIEDIKKTKAQEVVTPCPGCMIFIQKSLKGGGIDINVRHPVQLLSEAYRMGKAKQTKG
jgi:glycolate oxidase iron-sulfur subunit